MRVARILQMSALVVATACGGRIEEQPGDHPAEPGIPVAPLEPPSNAPSPAPAPAPSPSSSAGQDEPSSGLSGVAKGASKIAVGSWMAGELMAKVGDTCLPSQREHTVDLGTWKATARICVAAGANGSATMIVTNEVMLTGTQRSSVERELGKLEAVSGLRNACPRSGPRYELVVSRAPESTLYYDCAGLEIRPIKYLNASLQPLYTVLDGILMPGG